MIAILNAMPIVLWTEDVEPKTIRIGSEICSRNGVSYIPSQFIREHVRQSI